jgi:hypothetical protein
MKEATSEKNETEEVVKTSAEQAEEAEQEEQAEEEEEEPRCVCCGEVSLGQMVQCKPCKTKGKVDSWMHPHCASLCQLTPRNSTVAAATVLGATQRALSMDGGALACLACIGEAEKKELMDL